MATEETLLREIFDTGETGEAPTENIDASQTENDYYPTGKTVRVLNLPPSAMFTYVEDLQRSFSKHGQIISIKRGGITVNGSSTDVTISAYVRFANAESSEKALVENGTVIGGNKINVHILRAGPYCVKIDELPVQVSTECLRNLLQSCGPIKEINKIPARRVAFVEFENEEGLNKALGLNNKLLVNNVKLNIGKIESDRKESSKKSKINRGAEKRFRGKPRSWGNRNWGRDSGGWGTTSGSFHPYGSYSVHGSYRTGRGEVRSFQSDNSDIGEEIFYGGHMGNWGGDYFQNNFSDEIDTTPNRRKQSDWIRQY